jgi:L-threonylcarbamoyladenylate synthase
MIDFEYDIKQCIAALEAGNTILYPTDTVWGIGCNAMNEAAVNKVFELKNRPREKSMIILLAEAKDILTYVAAPHPDIIAIVESFEQPTTVIYENALELADNVINTDGSVAIRVTDDQFCKALIKRYQKPIVSTSANISGQPSPATFDMITDDIKNKTGYIVKYRRDDKTVKKPSRLVKIDDDGQIIVIRP